MLEISNPAMEADSEDGGQRPPLPRPVHAPAPAARDGGYRAGGRGRVSGLAFTIGVHVVVGALLVLRWHSAHVAQPPAALNIFDVAPPQPPAEEVKPAPPPPETPQAPRPVEQPQLVTPQVIIPTPATLPRPPERPTPPQIRPPEQKAPIEQPPAPPPPAGNAKPSWEGQVLAALHKVRRYPREAQFRKQQGVPYIRFVMDREGRVLSARLERSSGLRSLDEEAVSLPRRAQPLPRPPESVTGETIEMVVPVEFFLR